MRNFAMALFLGAVLFASPARADLSVGLAKKYARVIYDVALNGGDSVSHNLDAALPADAVITDLWIYINTKFTDSGTGSLAFQCAGTRDLMDWQDITGQDVDDVYAVQRSGLTFNQSSTTFIPDPTDGVQAGISSVVSACNVTAVVRGDSGYVPLTAGKATLLIEYFQP